MSNKESAQKLQLTHDQSCAMARFLEFVGGSGRVFILRGYAGTGKTTLVKEMIAQLKEMRMPYRLLASTGRAAKVLRDKTGEQTGTVHGCIYKYTGFNQDLDKVAAEREQTGVDSSGQLLLNFGLTAVDAKSTTVYFVDEASMVSDVKEKSPVQASFGSGRLLTDLLSYDSLGKFVFIGDNCQLPPVGQTISPAISASYIQQEFGEKAVEATLTDVKRQAADNDILLAAGRLRQLYEHPQTEYWAKFPLLGYRNIHVKSSSMELVQMYIERIQKYGYNDSTYICRSNRQCDTMTHLMRPALGFHSPQLQKGDLLLVTQNNYITGMMNGDQVVVDSVQVKEKRAGLTFYEVAYHELSTGKEYSQLLIADILYANQTNLSSAQQKELFIDFYYRMKDLGVRQKSDEFNRQMMSDPYLNALRTVYGYALTCHKTQGGEWDNVFLDIPRKLASDEKPGNYQWVYTAVTRASKELYIAKDFYLK